MRRHGRLNTLGQAGFLIFFGGMAAEASGAAIRGLDQIETFTGVAISDQTVDLGDKLMTGGAVGLAAGVLAVAASVVSTRGRRDETKPE